MSIGNKQVQYHNDKAKQGTQWMKTTNLTQKGHIRTSEEVYQKLRNWCVAILILNAKARKYRSKQIDDLSKQYEIKADYMVSFRQPGRLYVKQDKMISVNSNVDRQTEGFREREFVIK